MVIITIIKGTVLEIILILERIVYRSILFSKRILSILYHYVCKIWAYVLSQWKIQLSLLPPRIFWLFCNKGKHTQLKCISTTWEQSNKSNELAVI